MIVQVRNKWGVIWRHLKYLAGEISVYPLFIG